MIGEATTVALTALAGAVTALVALLAWGVRFGLRKLFGSDDNGGGSVGRLVRILEGIRSDLSTVEVRLRDANERASNLQDQVDEHMRRVEGDHSSMLRNLDGQSQLLREAVRILHDSQPAQPGQGQKGKPNP